MRILSRVAVAAVLSFGGVLAAQAPAPTSGPHGWRWRPVPQVDATVFAVCWQHGFDDDAEAESGLAAAVAEYRLLRARRAVSDATASGVRVVGDATVAYVLVPAARARDGLAFVRALLDDDAAADDDLAALALARAALAADDAEWLYPGPVLEGRARRALLTGGAARSVQGSAVRLLALTPTRLRERAQAPVPVRGLVLGAVGDELRAEVAAVPTPAEPPFALRRAANVRDAAPPSDAVVQSAHARLDGPFAALAFAVAEDVGRAALAVGIEVARMRAARELPLRGPEVRARAPLVAWSWLEGEPLVQCCRRGANGAEPAAAFAELDALVEDLRSRPPTAAECDIASRTLRWELGLTPLPPGTDGAALPGRAVALLLADLRGVTEAAVAGVTPEAAHAALRAVLDPPRACRSALVPTASR